MFIIYPTGKQAGSIHTKTYVKMSLAVFTGLVNTCLKVKFNYIGSKYINLNKHKSKLREWLKINECCICNSPITHIQIDVTNNTQQIIKFMCKNNSYLTTDHIIPTCRGGSKTSKANTLVMCKKCNNQKGAFTLAEFLYALQAKG